MVILENSLSPINTTSQTINQFETELVYGTGSFNNPLDIYLSGHKTYANFKYGEKTNPDISGIIKNIDLLNNREGIKLPDLNPAIKEFNKELLNDITLEMDVNAISVQLKFNEYNINALNNYYKNL